MCGVGVGGVWGTHADHNCLVGIYTPTESHCGMPAIKSSYHPYTTFFAALCVPAVDSMTYVRVEA